MNDAVIVSAVRTAIGKAPRGKLRTYRPEDMAAAVVAEALKRAPALKSAEIDDLILGCAFPEGEQGLNVARVIGLRAGLPYTVPAMTINRFCSSGMQAIALAVQQVMAGWGEAIIAGGVESMSMVPMTGFHFAPNPYMAQEYPGVYLGMGLTAENVAKEYGVTREEQDKFSFRSHQRAMAAIEAGRFKDEIVPLNVSIVDVLDGKKIENKYVFNVDEGPRRDTTVEALANLKPAFQQGGTVTAGNSSQTSDGAAAVVVMKRERAQALGLKALVTMRAFAVAGVKPEIMGIGPIEAIPKALKLAGLKVDDIGVIELNEAFAAQSLAIVKTLDLDPDKVNVNGGAIALGHPLGATGAKLTVQLINEMKRRKVQFGMVSMCIGGGMGAAGIFENVD